jgi:putative ABC transport system ATP-binding protein
MAAALFAFEGVTVEGGSGRTILSEVTASVPDGGITVIVGPSGAGKSTLLRLCNRLEVPSAGRVLLRGEDLAGLDPLALRRRVGMVFQRPTPFGGTVADNLRVAVPEIAEDAMAAALERTGLAGGFLSRAAADLSVGEAQRMCVARTLVTEPEVLLMDEPTSALDRDHRLELERLARRLSREGVPILWVTHDGEQVGRLADWVLALREGRLERSGPPDAPPTGASAVAETGGRDFG